MANYMVKGIVKDKGRVKGQVSVEFFLFIVILVVIFVTFFMLSENMNVIMYNLESTDRSYLVASSVARAINSVFLGRNGLSVEVAIPSNYTITLQPRAIFAMDANSRSGSDSLITSNVSFSVQPNALLVRIMNSNGTIIVTG